MSSITNYLSIDLEPRGVVSHPENAGRAELYGDDFEAVLRDILNVLAEADAHITFFILGETFDHRPDLVERIADSGHAIAYHGHRHRRLTSCDDLKNDLQMSARFLEAYSPVGFRAPWIDLPSGALDILASSGFRYDSSTFGRFPAELADSDSLSGANIITIPVTEWAPGGLSKLTGGSPARRLLGGRVALGSSFFVGLLGKSYGGVIERLNRRGESVVFYLHASQWTARRRPLGEYVTRPQAFAARHGLRPVVRSLLTRFDFAPTKTLLP